MSEPGEKARIAADFAHEKDQNDENKRLQETPKDCAAASNGVAERLNSKIIAIKRKACGYRNQDHFKTAIYFFCGGLDLYLVSS